MKDITDYFSSPSKARTSSEQADNVKSTDQNVNTENKIEDTPDGFKVNTKEPTKRKRKKRRKPTDPEIKDVTELLSSNLNLISPNTSGSKKINSPSSLKKKAKDIKRGSLEKKDDYCLKYNATKRPEKCKSVKNGDHVDGKSETHKTKPREIDENVDNSEEIEPTTSNIIEIKDAESDSESSKDAPKVNVFQFMMSSRNNIIGQNSNGKTAGEPDSTFSDQKSNLASRKDLFKNWADHKGGLKRKREEEQIERCIESKMEKRAKRLKKLLQLKTEEESTRIISRSKKAVRILSSSDSENSTDLSKLNEKKCKSSSPPLHDINEIITDENGHDALPVKKHQRENVQNNLLNFFGVLSKEERIEVFEDLPKESSRELIKIKMFTPESTKKRTSLLSLNRVRTKSMTDESSQESVKAKKHKKKKRKSTISTVEENSQSEGQLNDSLEDFVCTTEKVNTNVKKSRKNKLKKSVCDNDVEVLNSLVETPMCKLKTDNSSDKDKSDVLDSSLSSKNKKGVVMKESSQDHSVIKPKKKGSKYCGIVDDLDHSLSSEEKNLTKASDVKKGTKQHHIDNSEEQLNTDAHQDGTMRTGRTKKKHNMKTKTNKISSTETGTPQDKIKPQGTESPGRVLRPKKDNLNYSDVFQDPEPKSAKTTKKSSVKKGNKLSSKDESIEKIHLSSDSDCEETPKKVPVKVAPVFLKATPKPKLDPEVLEARKNFLLSGVPDSLKKTVEKQRSIEEKEYDIFPSISHIQQKCQSRLWDLSKVDLKYGEVTAFNLNEQSLTFHGLIVKKVPYKINITTDVKRVNNIKSLLDTIKAENSNYPVYKVFRHIYVKSGKNFLKKSPRRRPKKATQKNTELAESPDATILKDSEMWSEKYKPRSSEEILGNHKGVSALKNWLQIWMNYSEEINARGKRKRTDSNSESEFESTDCDSRDSTRLPGNTMILGGPCGSGKTSAVYAIASELGLNVLELNASSKRTGKRLMQELQEATQSHQVRKNALKNLVQPDKSGNKSIKSKKTEPEDKKKMCILLVEDIDLVFDQDDGFLASLSQLLMTSKRPVILTTTDYSPAHVQKLLSQYEYISFKPLSLHCLNVWLQIVCLVEGLVVDRDDLGNLLEYNKGDIRKTLLEVQFWSQSGGQLERSRKFPLRSQGASNTGDLKITDEELKIDLNERDIQEECFVHKHCLGSFEVLRVNKEFSVPHRFDLGTLWWNIPNILNVPSGTSERLHRQRGARTNEDISDEDGIKLNSLTRLYDALTLTDSLFQTINYQESNEPVVKNWVTEVRDSLELSERQDDRGMYLDLIGDLTHTLVNGHIENYRRIDDTSCQLDMAVPDTQERRWRTQQYICEEFLNEPIATVNTLDRSSIALDYLPTLRDIARYEEKRAASNTKRGNRFRHYLKNLNMNFKDGSCKLACNILSAIDDD